MKIKGPDKSHSTDKAGKTKKKKKSEGSTPFGSYVSETGGSGEEKADAAGSAGSVQGAQSIESLLALQEAPDSTDHASKGKSLLRAEDILDHLDELRMGLLTGSFTKQQLQSLSDSVSRERAETDDPRLEALLDEVDLRAKVELAKFGRY